MIIVKLMGGLGNQMFQYAAGRRLAWVSGVPLKLDLGWFQAPAPGTTPREYALRPFALAAEIASADEIARLAPRRELFGKLVARCLPLRTSYLPERHYHFDPALLVPRKNAYLDGYWQSEKYFCDIRDTICSDFTLQEPPQGKNRDLVERLAEPGLASVSLHVRRGDYLTSPSASSVHGSCSPQYYARAVAALAARVERPHFFLFSDEPEWVRDNFPLDHPCTIVAHNPPEKGHEDLRLMTLCRHHITANSSFSWWGAWLCRNRDKIVIAPANWFTGASYDTGDLIPATWTRV